MPARPSSSPVSSPTAPPRDDVAQLYRKVMAGQELSKTEKRALKRFEREKEVRLRWQFYGSIPQAHWIKMSGRQAKTLTEQAQRYGIPFGGAEVNLSAVVRALHDFLAANARKLAEEPDPLMVGGGSPALERYREERAVLAKMDRLERENSLVPRAEIRTALSRVAAILRGAGDTLQRQHGSDAAEVMFEALDEAQKEIDRAFGEDTDASAAK